ncbi:MAG: SH3 domain-containing protein [Terriglobia bacterium]
MKNIILAIALLLPLNALAQGQPSRRQTLEKLSHELAEMQSVVEASSSGSFATHTTSENATVTSSNAAIHAGANASSPVVTRPQVGEEIKLAGREGNWYKVESSEARGPKAKGWIETTKVEPFAAVSANTYSSDALFQKLTEMASKIRDEYKDNPYIRVTGFDVEIGVPPSVTINVQFK